MQNIDIIQGSMSIHDSESALVAKSIAHKFRFIQRYNRIKEWLHYP